MTRHEPGAAPIYERTQPGRVILWTFGTIALVSLGVMLVVLPGRMPFVAVLLIGAIVLLPAGLLAWLFSGLTVQVTSADVRVKFGPGWQIRRIPLTRIESVEAIEYPWYYGWGIRLTPRGTLYNVSGTRAVLLTLRGQQPVLIGTDDPEGLRDALAAALERAREG